MCTWTYRKSRSTMASRGTQWAILIGAYQVQLQHKTLKHKCYNIVLICYSKKTLAMIALCYLINNTTNIGKRTYIYVVSEINTNYYFFYLKMNYNVCICIIVAFNNIHFASFSDKLFLSIHHNANLINVTVIELG